MMKLGYVPCNNCDLKGEIDFGKKHFDFIELTPDKNLNEYINQYGSMLCETLNNFLVIGHLHRTINIGSNNAMEIQIALATIKFLHSIGVKQITIHPSYQRDIVTFMNLGHNLNGLNKINQYCKKLGIKLLLENTCDELFSKPETINFICENIDNIGLTLDTGHAIKTGNIKGFSPQKGIRFNHIHLHDCKNGNDHIAFDKMECIEHISETLDLKNNGSTISIEVFKQLNNCGKIALELDNAKRKEVILRQQQLIKECLSK